MARDDASSIPQVAVCVIVGYLVFRWFFKGNSNAAATTTASSAAVRQRPVDSRRLAQQVEVIHGMFPQFSTAAIEAELRRNGGNIEVATERILTTGHLPEPPRPAQPAVPAPTRSSSSSSAASRPQPASSRQRTAAPAASGSSNSGSGQFTDLITRYNLHARLKEARENGSLALVENGKGKAPASKADRQMAHKAKRDQMVLTARLTLEKMIAEENAAAAGNGA